MLAKCVNIIGSLHMLQRVRYKSKTVQKDIVQVICHHIVESPQQIKTKVQNARVVLLLDGQKVLLREVRHHLRFNRTITCYNTE